MPDVAEQPTETIASGVRIEMVPPVALDGIWPLVEPLLAPLFEEYPLENLDDVRASIESTHRQLWLVLKGGDIAAAAVTQIVPFPRARVLELPWLAGSGITDMIEQMDEWVTQVAREKACSVIRIYGRDGWTRSFKKIGGKRAAIVYQKDVPA